MVRNWGLYPEGLGALYPEGLGADLTLTKKSGQNTFAPN